MQAVFCATGSAGSDTWYVCVKNIVFLTAADVHRLGLLGLSLRGGCVLTSVLSEVGGRLLNS